MPNRRTFLKTAGAVGAAGLIAGCTGGSGTETATGTPKPYGNGTLNFIMSPSEPQDQMIAQYKPVKQYLSENVHQTNLKYARNYSAVIAALGSGTADVAEMGPFAAALGVKADKADIALQRKGYGSYEYSSVIVTKKDSGVSSLKDLEGKKVAFADRLSASGGLFPLYMLKKAGVNIGNLPEGSGGAAFEANFAGGHGAAFKALESGQVAAAGVGKFITLTENDQGERVLKDGYEYVKTHDGIPRAPIATSPALPDEEASAVTQALLEAPESMYHGADGKADTDDDLWFSDVRKASVETYQPVIDVANELGISAEFLDK